jgi:hypothetical protein
MKLSELARRIKTIRVGDIVKWKNLYGSYYYTKVVAIDNDEVGGWWYDHKESCDHIGSTDIAAWKAIKECEIV